MGSRDIIGLESLKVPVKTAFQQALRMVAGSFICSYVGEPYIQAADDDRITPLELQAIEPRPIAVNNIRHAKELSVGREL